MADYSKLSFTSAFRYEYIHIKGSVAITTGSFLRTITIPHNLGYTPYFKLWYQFNSGKIFSLFSGPSSYDLDGNSEQVDNIYADDYNLYVTLLDFTFGTGHSGTIYYRIYAEPVI